jgi:hypothetical protein
MSLALLLNQPRTISPRARLTLDHITAAAKRIFDRWPDIVPPVLEKDQEQIVLEMNEKLKTGNWRGTSVAKVARAARVLFSERFRSREEFQNLRRFYLDEIRGNPSRGFISSMFSVYITSYEPGSGHTVEMSQAFIECSDRLSARWQQLLLRAPEILDPKKGHQTLGAKIAAMDSIWQELRQMGFSAPHAPGIIDHAHLHYLKTVGSRFSEWAQVERLLLWLKPGQGNPRLSGAVQSIEAMLNPWLKKDCPDHFRDPLLERLVSLYGDPRVSQAAHWIAVRKEYVDLLHRWLTKADMGFFIEVVTNTQPSHMWPPRRDFWLKLYRQGRIDAAWVAFCPDAANYAKQHLISSRELDVSKRFGRQLAKGSYGTTSLLIMKIGRKILVDGCHSYKTHIFDVGDPAAPSLFSQEYDCYSIRNSSRRSKSHTSIETWSSWVMMQVLPGADLYPQRVVDAPQHPEISMPQPKAVVSTGVSPNTKAEETVRAYSRLLVQSLGPEASGPRVQLFERLLKAGAVMDAVMVEDSKDRCFMVLRCKEEVSVVDAPHYINTRIVHPDPAFSNQWRALDVSRRAAFLSRWNYTVAVTQAPLSDFVNRFLDVLSNGRGLSFFRSV